MLASVMPSKSVLGEAKNAGKRAQNDARISYAEQERFRRSQNRNDVIAEATILLQPKQVCEQDLH